MRYRIGMLTLALILSVPVSAQNSVQQDFDAATALADKGDHAGALTAWEALEKRLSKNQRSQAVVALRKSRALMMLGRRDEAAVTARAALDVLPADDASLREDRARGFLTLGLVAGEALDYASAASNYRIAETLATTLPDRFLALHGLINTQTFVDPDAALADAARANAMVDVKDFDPKARGMMKTAISQLHLNLGDAKTARQEAAAAVASLGGLSIRTDLLDVAARSNLALAALKLGQYERARQHFAMSGAGRSSKGRFVVADTQPPPCGEGGLTPDDYAVIEYTIDDNGAVKSSAPVYGSRKGGMALIFARAARNWSWRPEELAELPPFFRYRARVEMRCSVAFKRPDVNMFLDNEVVAWLVAKGAALPTRLEGSEAMRAVALRAELTRMEQSGDTLNGAPVLHALASNVTVPREDQHRYAKRLLALVAAEEAPLIVKLAVNIRIWRTQNADGMTSKEYKAVLSRALSSSDYANDPRANAALAIVLAETLSRSDTKRAKLLQQVAEDSVLAKGDVLKTGAAIRLASLKKMQGDLAAAQTAFDRSGVLANQCAVLDSLPKMAKFGASSYDYPVQEIQVGFGGWVRLEYDVTADGRTANQRVIASYPPFVFSDTALAMMKDSKFEASYRPDGGAGCGGAQRNIVFGTP